MSNSHFYQTQLSEPSSSCTNQMHEPRADFHSFRAGASSENPYGPACNSDSQTATEGTINMTDPKVDLPSLPQHPETQTHNERPSPSATLVECKKPSQCELSSPDLAQAMIRFSVPHICQYEQAKTLLVKKIVNKVLDDAAPRIMALLEEELQKREAEMEDEEEEEDEDMDMGSDFESEV